MNIRIRIARKVAWTTVQESHCSPAVITTRAEWRDDSGGVKFAINNNDNKMSEGGGNIARRHY